MRNHRLRASWITTILATVIAVATPLVGGVGDVRAGASSIRSIDHLRAEVERTGDTSPCAERTQPRRDRPTTTHLLVRIPRPMAVRARPDADAAVVGTMPSGSKYYGVADHRLGRGDGEPRALGARGDPVRVAPTRRVDPAPRVGAVEHPRAGARRSVRAPAHRVEVRPHAVRAASRDRRTHLTDPPGRLLRHRPDPVPLGWVAGDVRVRDLRHPAQTSARAGAVATSSRSTARTIRRRSVRRRARAACGSANTALDRLLPLLRLGTPVIVEP